MMKFIDKYVNEDKNNNPIIFNTKKRLSSQVLYAFVLRWLLVL